MPPFQEQSFFVSAVSGDVSWAKFRMCPRKKLQSPKNCRTSCTLDVGGAFFTAFSLSVPGIMPSSVRQKPRYDTSLLPNTHFWRLILMLCVTKRCKTLLRVTICSS